MQKGENQDRKVNEKKEEETQEKRREKPYARTGKEGKKARQEGK